jgi:hypothetical protein
VLQLPFAKFLQHAFAQKVGIALARLGKLDA